MSPAARLLMLSLHVLVVEADPLAMQRVQRTLEEAGHQVTCRTQTLGVRADILALRPDLVLLSPIAPGIRGDDLTLLLGLHPETADVPIIYHCSESPELARRAGALGAIARSAEPPEFLRQFEELARAYLASGLPKEDRAALADRMFSGTHRVASAAHLPRLKVSGS